MAHEKGPALRGPSHAEPHLAGGRRLAAPLPVTWLCRQLGWIIDGTTTDIVPLFQRTLSVPIGPTDSTTPTAPSLTRVTRSPTE